MIDMFAYPFMQRALAAGVLTGFVAGYFGVFVVQRGLSFMGSGLAHATFGGVALGLLLGAEPLWVAIPFTLATALGIVWVQNRTRLSGDVTIGVFFSVAMALGVIFLSFRQNYTTDAFQYLFGSILAVMPVDLWASGAVAAGTLATFPAWGRWAYASFDRELAQADGVRALRDDYLLAGALAVTIVAAVKLVGIVLIAAFLVIPAATARLTARTFFGMTLLSIALGVGSSAAGLAASYALDLPSGPAVILVMAALFFASLALKRG